jgi:FAD synthase
VRFIDRLRDELKFNSVEELKAQIARDIVDATGRLRDGN